MKQLIYDFIIAWIFYIVFDISYGSKSDVRPDLLVALLMNKSQIMDNSALPIRITITSVGDRYTDFSGLTASEI